MHQYNVPIERRLHYPLQHTAINQPQQFRVQHQHKKENLFSPLRSSPQKFTIQTPILNAMPNPMPQNISIDFSKQQELERDIRVMIDNNNRIKEQLNQVTIDYQHLKISYDKLEQEHNNLLRKNQVVTDFGQKEVQTKQEQIKELQHFIESNNNAFNRANEDVAQLKQQLNHKEQEILRMKVIIDEKSIENQEIRNTLSTINTKVQFINQQKDQQIQILEQFNKELQDEIQQKTQIIHTTSQNLSTTQTELNELIMEYDTMKNKVQSQQSQMPLQSLQQKYLLLMTENERLHKVIENESIRNKEFMVKLHQSYKDVDGYKYEITKVAEECTKLQQSLYYEQKNQYLIEDLRKQLNYYGDENARLQQMIYNRQ